MEFLWFPVIAFGVYFVALSIGRAFRRKVLREQTCLLDADNLGVRHAGGKIKDTAVICGGSVRGLITARVCHDHFEQVVIVEPEAWKEDKRSRIMQYNSLHSRIRSPFLLAMGFVVLSKLFPNLDEECKACGIRIGPNEAHTFVSGKRIQSPKAEYGGSLPKTTYAGRPGLETLIRRLVLGGNYKNIRQIKGTVTGTSRDGVDPQFLESVTVRTPEGTMNIPATLVVDCTGPAMAGIKWLGREGYGFADKYSKNQLPLDKLKITYDQKLHYSTLQFRVPPELGRRLPGLPVPYDECGVIYCLFTDPAKDHRIMYSQRVDGDILQVAFLAWGECELPTTLEEVKACARSLVTQEPIPQTFFDMLDALKEVEDTMTCSRLGFPRSSYIRYERAVNLPSNWVALGDSVMRVNPIHGQGCTKAFFGALCLNTLLQNLTAIPKGFSKKYFDMHTAKVAPLWHATKTGGKHALSITAYDWLIFLDYAYPTTIPVSGETLAKGSWLRWYTRKLYAVAFNDAQAGSALWHSRVLLAPSTDMFQLGLVLKVLWNVIKSPQA
ncbi:uncharacterized protein EV420DRAFT_1676791 [Desarmillaria tabescens]|uniref:FAD/NAD(P)-binding domain-containing protein n=1 Tax=Armillaria tabescens TaxID=1929756 RepID=A0AA39KDE5_ARMTA|nr:uncharacterized protein EV420DRAFT_1676791 [Desarmillaria tabescens]KAK0459070.1 hypothetical protein EV420DRAFT_1676791 [Desarmillaria tabescens]